MTATLTFVDPTAADSVRDRRDSRHALRRFNSKNSSIPRVAGCGLCTPGNDVAIRVSKAGNRLVAGASGLITCSSVWSCPVCSAKISTERSQVVADAIRRWNSTGGRVLFATFTLRHNSSQDLATVWDGLADSWRHFLGGKGWKDLRNQFSLDGWIRAVEVTYGANGWHVHAHTAVFVSGTDTTPAFLDRLSDALYHRWELATNANGFSTTRDAFDCRATFSDSGLARYLVKSSNVHNTARELTHGTSKTARKTSRTPFAILADLAATKTFDCRCSISLNDDGSIRYRKTCDACLWRHWEKNSHGRRQISFSTGFRAIIDNIELPETTDSDEILTDSMVVLLIDPSSWRRLAETDAPVRLYRNLECHRLDLALELLTNFQALYRPGPDLQAYRTIPAQHPLPLLSVVTPA